MSRQRAEGEDYQAMKDAHAVADAAQRLSAARQDAPGPDLVSEGTRRRPRHSRAFLDGLPPQTERAFMGQVIAYARLMGWAMYHTHDSRRSEAGFPDLVMTRRPRILFAEMKNERGRLSDAQRAWIEELRACGQEVFVWRPSDFREIERVLR